MIPSLESAIALVRHEIAPLANAMDTDENLIESALQTLGAHNLLALRAPSVYGGPNWPDHDFRQFQIEMARASGTLAFLQTQHQSAASMLAKSQNEPLKHRCLPGMSSGQTRIGIGFSQLRRPGPPLITATPVEGGYLLNGHVPWVTGDTFYPEFLVGATLPDGQSVFGVVPLRAQPGITLSPPMSLAAMQAARTVTVDFDNTLLPSENVAFIHPADWIQNNDMINVTLQGFFALGCARAGIDIVQSAAEKRNNSVLSQTATALLREWDACREALDQPATSTPIEDRLNTRAWAIELCARCAHAGVVASSGAANSTAHAAQRVYREALVFSVSAQTTAIMEATLQRLIARAGQPALK